MIYKHNLSRDEWEAKKKDIINILIEQALLPRELQGRLTYKGLCDRMKSPPPQGPNSYELRDLLDEIENDENEVGRGMLTVFVFNEELNRPGPGFYTAAKRFGYSFKNTENGKTEFADEQMRLVSRQQKELQAKS